jgi:hypothetical protein
MSVTLCTAYCECVSVALGTQHAASIDHIIIYGLSGCNIFQYFPTNVTIFGKKNSLIIKSEF